jgi:hypothetical protein
VVQPSDVVMPSGEALLQEERRVRRQGSGLDATALLGCWQLDLVWPKGSGRPAQFSGQILRWLGAQLEISQAGEQLRLRNAVSLGPIELRFEGPGVLEGRRPLLWFHFEQLQIWVAGRCWFSRSLPAPAAQKRPFFALIQRDPSGWLAARGRGGGLACWRLRL